MTTMHIFIQIHKGYSPLNSKDIHYKENNSSTKIVKKNKICIEVYKNNKEVRENFLYLNLKCKRIFSLFDSTWVKHRRLHAHIEIKTEEEMWSKNEKVIAKRKLNVAFFYWGNSKCSICGKWEFKNWCHLIWITNEQRYWQINYFTWLGV